MTLIVVSGAPGTGKSAVAAAVAGALRWPLLSLDPVKEALADVLGLGDEDWSNRVGDGTQAGRRPRRRPVRTAGAGRRGR